MSLVALYGKLEGVKRYSLIMEFADGGDMYADIVKNQKEGSASDDDDPVERKPDKDSWDLLDAVAEDLLKAFERKDRGMVKAALQSLCEHIQDQDTEQDQAMMGAQG